MEPTERFFAKLKKLAVTLESETAKFQHCFEKRNSDGDSETTAKAMRAYHQLNCDVGNLKGQIQGHVSQLRAQENEVSSFIMACRVMEQSIAKDVQTLAAHWEKYGYQGRPDTKRPTRARGQDSEAEDEEADENETKSAEDEESQEEAGDNPSASPSMVGPQPSTDRMRTPQLADFGLSELQLKRTLTAAEWCAEVPPMPEMNLPHPSLNPPASPAMPLTPKCALRMDDDELLTPQMSDFGITERTVCLNNDFTMDLFRKNVEKPQRPSQDMPAAPVNALMESLHTKAQTLLSPEPPVFCTPGFKIKKTNGHCSPPAQSNGDPESPDRPENLPTTPEVPTFQTPHMNRLVSSKKGAQQPEPINMQGDDDLHTFELPSSSTAATGSKRPWEYNVPEISVLGGEDKQMPEMPNLESVLGNSLQTRSAKMPKKTMDHIQVTKEPTVKNLELDGPTQEFSLGTPRIRMDYQDPSTPEMPDLSSVTQDICKLMAQPPLKKTALAVVHPETNKNSIGSLSEVTEYEFYSLPSYLMRQMTLNSLNRTINNINRFTAENRGRQTDFRMEELNRICCVGAKLPIYILCLTELNKLEHIRGTKNTSEYKLCTQN
ncbi:spindle and kinetochore-associated protein 3 [Centropristis striata]|uniref:spindle and kinetochore-associated protein 3 n=1 Tax=Centropristis striata TaxID=184440 RepID=UPI0027E1DE1B|nr:spindle and kinetochore-associated protein 3 [Centropristis striata]